MTHQPGNGEQAIYGSMHNFPVMLSQWVEDDARRATIESLAFVFV